MSDISNKFREQQEAFREARINLAIEAARIRGEKHANCDENTPSTLVDLYAHYQPGNRSHPGTKYNDEVMAVCNGCGVTFKREYTREEWKRIVKEREQFESYWRKPTI